MGFAIGQNVGPYRVTAQLGSGGMATVYKAYHAGLDRYVAIKVMHQALKEDPNFFARFQREARIVARLEHPHIVPVYDFSEHEGQPYLVMRFIEGETLKARLQAGKLALSQVMDIMRPVCQALAYAHAQGVLHRDIKPSNILITAQMQVFLTDFGLAKIAQSGESTLSQDVMVGTPQYISPEQAQGLSDLDVRTDIYSLGVVLYELLVGRVPFQADTPYAVVHDHIFTPLPMPRSLRPDLPEPFERVLLKALAKERGDRYAAVTDLLAALEKAADSSQPAADSSQPAAESAQPTAESAQPAPTRIAPAAAAAVAAPTVISPPVAALAPSAPTRKSSRKLWIALGAVALVAVCIVALLAANFLPARQHLSNARRLRDQGMIDQALAEYLAVTRSNRRVIEAYIEPAQMLLLRGQPGDFLRAAQICETGLRVEPRNEQLRMDAAHAYFATNDLELAVPHLEWLIKNRPDDAWPHAVMALVFLQKGQFDAALEEAQQAVRRDPGLVEGHLALGMFYARTGQPEQAGEQFRLVLDNPDIPPWIRERVQQVVNEIKP